MSETIQSTKSILSDTASSVEGVVADLRHAVEDRVDDVISRAKQTGFETVLKSRAYVEDKPFQALAIAFGVGYVLKTLRPGFLVTVGLLASAAYLGTRLAPR